MQYGVKYVSLSVATIGRYTIVGVSVAGVYLGMLSLLEIVDFAPSMVNSAIAFVIAVIFQYIAQGAFTFKRALKDSGQIARFATTVTAGLAISTFIVGHAGPSLGYSTLASSFVVVALLPIFNFLMFLFWVFVDGARRPTI